MKENRFLNFLRWRENWNCLHRSMCVCSSIYAHTYIQNTALQVAKFWNNFERLQIMYRKKLKRSGSHFIMIGPWNPHDSYHHIPVLLYCLWLTNLYFPGRSLIMSNWLQWENGEGGRTWRYILNPINLTYLCNWLAL